MYDECKFIKDQIDKIRKISLKMYVLEEEKKESVKRDDFDRAQEIKNTMQKAEKLLEFYPSDKYKYNENLKKEVQKKKVENANNNNIISYKNTNEDIRIQNHIHRLRVFINLSVEFYYYIFLYYKLSDRISGKGIGIQGLSSNQLHNITVPVPPLEEQKRIADKINELMGLVDVIEQNKTDLQTAVKLAKEKILDLAIRGQLVPQNPDDEPASVLLERIRAEKQQLIKQGKIKPDKKDTVTFTDDELPFELPDGWEWTKLSNIANIIMGSSPSGKAVCDNPKYTEFHQGKICFGDKYLNPSNQTTSEPTKIAPANSTLLCSVVIDIGLNRFFFFFIGVIV